MNEPELWVRCPKTIVTASSYGGAGFWCSEHLSADEYEGGGHLVRVPDGAVERMARAAWVAASPEGFEPTPLDVRLMAAVLASVLGGEGQ